MVNTDARGGEMAGDGSSVLRQERAGGGQEDPAGTARAGARPERPLAPDGRCVSGELAGPLKGSVARTTHGQYAALVRRYLVRGMGKIKLKELTAQDLDDLYADMEERDVGARTARYVHQVTSSALQRAARKHLISFNVPLRRPAADARERGAASGPEPERRSPQTGLAPGAARSPEPGCRLLLVSPPRGLRCRRHAGDEPSHSRRLTDGVEPVSRAKRQEYSGWHRTAQLGRLEFDGVEERTR